MIGCEGCSHRRQQTNSVIIVFIVCLANKDTNPFNFMSLFYEDEIVQGNCDAGDVGVTMMTKLLEV